MSRGSEQSAVGSMQKAVDGNDFIYCNENNFILRKNDHDEFNTKKREHTHCR